MSFFKLLKGAPRNQPRVNSPSVPTNTIVNQMNKFRPLPMGQKEFVEWSDRIISGALVPTDDRDSLVAALAAMLMQLGPTESHKPDAYFIHSLRKAAANEVAHANFQQIKKKKEEAALKEKTEQEAPKKEIENAFKEAEAREAAKSSNLRHL